MAGNGSPRSRRSSGSTWRTACGLRAQLRQVMPVVNRPLPKSPARMPNPRPVAADDGHGRGPDADDEIQPGPATRHRVDGALEPDQGARRYRGDRRGLGARTGSARGGTGAAPRKAHADGLPGGITCGVEPRIHLCQQGLVDGRERRADRNRHERLLANGLAPGLDAPLVMGPRRAGRSRAPPDNARRAP